MASYIAMSAGIIITADADVHQIVPISAGGAGSDVAKSSASEIKISRSRGLGELPIAQPSQAAGLATADDKFDRAWQRVQAATDRVFHEFQPWEQAVRVEHVIAEQTQTNNSQTLCVSRRSNPARNRRLKTSQLE